jgi:hypothetical protein
MMSEHAQNARRVLFGKLWELFKLNVCPIFGEFGLKRAKCSNPSERVKMNNYLSKIFHKCY